MNALLLLTMVLAVQEPFPTQPPKATALRPVQFPPFKEVALPKGRMFVREELVRPQAIRETALLTVEGELDDISGNGQTEAAHALCLNIPRERRAHFVAPGVGHYGIFSGRRWRETVFPRVREFMRAHSS